MVLIGSGNNHLPLIYARDVAEGMLLATEKPNAIGQTYNLVNDEPVTQRDYLTAIATELGVEPPKRHIPYKIALSVATAAEASSHLSHSRKVPFLTRFGVRLLGGENLFRIDKARQELGFCPQMSLAEGVRRSVTWFREVNGSGAASGNASRVGSEQRA
jgi:nucleoside-diphosphate-sugar epimerase